MSNIRMGIFGYPESSMPRVMPFECQTKEDGCPSLAQKALKLCGNPSKVHSINLERHHVGKRPPLVRKKRGCQSLPVVVTDPKSSKQTYQKVCSQKGFKVSPTDHSLWSSENTVIPQKVTNPFVVHLGRIDCFQNLLIAGSENFHVHYWTKVRITIGVTHGPAENPTLGFEFNVQFGPRLCLQNVNHSHGNACFLNEVNHVLDKSGWIRVKSHNKSRQGNQSVILNILHISNQIATKVLDFFALPKTRFIARFKAKKHLFDTGLNHQVH